MAKHQTFRANVGIVVIDQSGSVLACERRDSPGAWQLPQGGLRCDEEPEPAALRELHEETGLLPEQVHKIAEHPGWIAYQLPQAYRSKKLGRGQVQKWYLYRLVSGRPIKLARSKEFVAYKWLSLSELSAKVWSVRRPIYLELQRAFGEHLRGPIADD